MPKPSGVLTSVSEKGVATAVAADGPEASGAPHTVAPGGGWGGIGPGTNCAPPCGAAGLGLGGRARARARARARG